MGNGSGNAARGSIQLIGMDDAVTMSTPASASASASVSAPDSGQKLWQTRVAPIRKHLRSLYALSRVRCIARQKSVEDVERQSKRGRIAPTVEGRVYIVHAEVSESRSSASTP